MTKWPKIIMKKENKQFVDEWDTDCCRWDLNWKNALQDFKIRELSHLSWNRTSQFITLKPPKIKNKEDG
jgi:hypothetical protein